jgi:hypothetical protein
VNSAKIADGTVGKGDLANNAVNSAKIVDGQVLTADIGNNAVNSAKIADGQVGKGDLGSNAVNSAKIVDGQVLTADIGNNAVNSAKIADGAVATADLANNAVNSAKVANGSLTAADLAAGTIYSGPNWGVMHRNVIGNGDSYLEAGPGFVQVGEPPDVEVVLTPAPLGVGSLGLRTGSNTDKAAFGNALDFLLDPVSGLTAVSFQVFTTGENIDISPTNLPHIDIEILANLEPDAGDYTTMVYEPGPQAPGWQFHDAVADPDPHWRLTGAEGTQTGCNDTTFCTFANLLDALDDGGPPATIGTVGISVGAFAAFSGAVDALRINDTVYDFEPNGVFETPAGP